MCHCLLYKCCLHKADSHNKKKELCSVNCQNSLIVIQSVLCYLFVTYKAIDNL